MTASIGHNSGFDERSLLKFVERMERLAEEKQGITDDMKEVIAEVKGVGFDVKTFRRTLQRRRMDKHDREEADSMLDLYEEALRRAEAAAFRESEASGT